MFHVKHPNILNMMIGQYISILIQWNKKINLIRDVGNIRNRHVNNSLILAEYITNIDKKTIVDIGSGNGMPGIILAIMGAKKVTLIESCHKKYIFLLYVISKLKLSNTIAINERVEDIKNITADIITARAFRETATLISLCSNIFYKEKILLLKGKNLKEELKYVANIKYKIYPIKPEGYILEITK